MNSDHKPKTTPENAYIAVLPAECHSTWAACWN